MLEATGSGAGSYRGSVGLYCAAVEEEGGVGGVELE